MKDYLSAPQCYLPCFRGQREKQGGFYSVPRTLICVRSIYSVGAGVLAFKMGHFSVNITLS